MATKVKNKSSKEFRKNKRSSERSLARLGSVQALYQMDITGISTQLVIMEYAHHRLGKDEDGNELGVADTEFFRDIVNGVVEKQREIDPKVDKHLSEDWRLNRIDPILRAILRAGGYELFYRNDVPSAAIINEYVDIAHAFFNNEIPKMVNGVLDSLAKEIRSS